MACSSRKRATVLDLLTPKCEHLGNKEEVNVSTWGKNTPPRAQLAPAHLLREAAPVRGVPHVKPFSFGLVRKTNDYSPMGDNKHKQMTTPLGDNKHKQTTTPPGGQQTQTNDYPPWGTTGPLRPTPRPLHPPPHHFPPSRPRLQGLALESSPSRPRL